MTSYEPTISDWANPPGATISCLLKKNDISFDQFSRSIGATRLEAKRLLSGHVKIDLLIAQELSSSLGGSVDFWIKRESNYRKALEASEKLKPGAWLSQLPVKEMKAWGWIEESGCDLNSALEFFNVDSPRSWYAKYEHQLGTVAFRKSKNTFRLGLVSSWLRRAEKLSESIHCSNWNPQTFQETLSSCKALTYERDPRVFMPKIQSLCAGAGVAVVFARSPSGSGISGATKFLSPRKALLCLSFRHLSDDHLWFTFFHEAGHLLLHGDHETYIEGAETQPDQQEREADQFAQDFIVPRESRAQLIAARHSRYEVARLARSLGVSPGMLVGQLQKEGLLPYNRMNNMKRRFDWATLEI